MRAYGLINYLIEDTNLGEEEFNALSADIMTTLKEKYPFLHFDSPPLKDETETEIEVLYSTAKERVASSMPLSVLAKTFLLPFERERMTELYERVFGSVIGMEI